MALDEVRYSGIGLGSIDLFLLLINTETCLAQISRTNLGSGRNMSKDGVNMVSCIIQLYYNLVIYKYTRYCNNWLIGVDRNESTISRGRAQIRLKHHWKRKLMKTCLINVGVQS